MVRKALAASWRGIKSIFTLKGALTVSVLVFLVAGALFALPRTLHEPRRVAMPESGNTSGIESTSTPRMALVITGLGGEGRGLDTLIARLLALNVPVTYVVLPGTPTTRRHSQLVSAAPNEVDLHLPVTFSRGANPNSPGGVHPKMRRRQIGRQVVTDIGTIGEVAGVAAAGGYAKGRTDAQMMRIVMTMAKRRNLHFLDLTSNTAAERIADELAVPYFAPDVELDKVPTADAVKRQMSIAINKAVGSKTNVIVLARLLPVTVNTLQELVAKIKESGIELTSISQLNASTEPTVTPSETPSPTIEATPSVPGIEGTGPAPAPGSQFQF